MAFASVGNKNSAARLIAAEAHLVEALARCGNVGEEDAKIAAAYYLKHKIAKLDMVMGRSSVKHGAYLDASAIAKAIELSKAAA